MKKIVEIEIGKLEDLQEGDHYFNGNVKDNPLMRVSLNTKAETSFLIGAEQGRRRLSNEAVQGLLDGGTKFYGMREIEVPDEVKPEPKKQGQNRPQNSRSGNKGQKPRHNQGKLAQISSNEEVETNGTQLMENLNSTASEKTEDLLVGA
jgi:hypothetical protein